MAYVYRHIRLDKNEPFYIGIGSETLKKKLYDRAYEKRKRNSVWRRIVAKSDYEVDILISGISYGEAQAKEIEFIALYGRIKNGGTLANLTDGGGGSLGQETTNKQRETARLKATGNKYCVGRVLSAETKNKIAEKTRSQVNIFSKPIVKYSTLGVFVKEYRSTVEADKDGCGYAYQITAALKRRFNGKSIYNGFVWRYRKDVEVGGCVAQNIEILSSELYQVRTAESRRRKVTKLNMDMATEIRESPLASVELSKKYKVSVTTIYHIRANKQWKKPIT